MTQIEKKEAIDYIKSQLTDGYIDLVLHDENEIEIVRKAINAYINIDKKQNMDKDKIIKKLDRLKEDNPNQVISIETPNGCAECKIGDTNIYEGCNGEIVIDSE